MKKIKLNKNNLHLIKKGTILIGIDKKSFWNFKSIIIKKTDKFLTLFFIQHVSKTYEKTLRCIFFNNLKLNFNSSKIDYFLIF